MKDETGGAPTGLRLTALIALVIGAVGSIGLWIRAAQHPPPLIVVLFVVWVLSPFVFLGVAQMSSRRWTMAAPRSLYWVTIFVAITSLAIYADDAVAHRATHPAFVYVAVPPASWLVTAVAIGLGAWMARKKLSQDGV